MSNKDCEALASACAEHLKSGGDAISEAAFASGWQAAQGHYASRLASLVAACEKFRDSVLNQRWHLEEPCLDNDQTNAVLSELDDTIGVAIAAPEAV